MSAPAGGKGKPSADEIAELRKLKAVAKAAKSEAKAAGQPQPSPPPAQSQKRASPVAPPSQSSASLSSPASSLPATPSSHLQSSLPPPAHTKSKESAPQPPSRPQLQYDNLKKKKKYEKQSILNRTEVAKQFPLFSHLPQYERETELSIKVGFLNSEIPSPILRLGLAYSHGTITGSNARCVAMLTAFKQVIQFYTTPPNKLIRDDLLQRIKPWVRFLSDCRPLSVSMGNAIRFFKSKIARLEPTTDDSDAKAELIAEIDSFIQARIVLADQVIAQAGAARINNGDTILTYATSHVIEMLLIKARNDGKIFRVIVVDSRPNASSGNDGHQSEACQLLQRLLAAGQSCTYVLLSAVSNVMPTASLVLMGAYAMLSNGSCVSRAGTAIVAMIAKTYSVPVLIACEVYKFAERVQLDSIAANELGDPDEIIEAAQNNSGNSVDSVDLSNWRDQSHLKLLNLVYDLTPVEFVTMVVTEVGNVPPTSVPVILREYHGEADANSDFME